MRNKFLLVVLCAVCAVGLISCSKYEKPQSSKAPEVGMVDINTTDENVVSEDNKGDGETSTPEVSDSDVISIGTAPGNGLPLNPSVTETPVDIDPGVDPAITVTPVVTEAPSNNDVKPNPFDSSDISVVYNGVALKPGDSFDDNINKVGSNPDVQQAQSCISAGMDITYMYGSDITVSTYVSGNAHKIWNITIGKKGFKTAKGIEIGTTNRNVLNSIYGEPNKAMPLSDKYELSGTSYVVSFLYEDDIVIRMDISDISVQ